MWVKLRIHLYLMFGWEPAQTNPLLFWRIFSKVYYSCTTSDECIMYMSSWTTSTTPGRAGTWFLNPLSVLYWTIIFIPRLAVYIYIQGEPVSVGLKVEDDMWENFKVWKFFDKTLFLHITYLTKEFFFIKIDFD